MELSVPPAHIEVQKLTVEFPAVRALDNVSLSLVGGKVHGIIGENGAGKSTLMRVLAGLQTPTSGSASISGHPIPKGDPAAAIRMGIAMVHQELNLIDELSVADNVLLGREFRTMGLVATRRTRREAERILRSFGCDVDPAAKVKSLSIAQQQMVEIGKALACNARVLIMDEPTAVLTKRETSRLFDLIRTLRERGVTVLYISHLLPEVIAICDTITVLRDGRLVTSLIEHEARAATESKLASLMVGRPMADHFPARMPCHEPVFLDVCEVSVPGFVDRATFDVKRGEIFGFAGLIGAGRTELAEALVGLRKCSGGAITLDGKAIRPRSLQQAIRHGMAYVSEDRKGAGLTLDMSITANTTLATLKRYAAGLIRRRAERDAAAAQAEAFDLKFGRLSDPVRTLSGGNQQKVALGKWMDTRPQLLILDEPTRGVDIGAKEGIYRHIQRLSREGISCILISSELNELLGMCHRIAVMRGGRIVTVVDGESATEERIMHHAAGVKEEQAA